ncbi:hypothetical protein M472_02215 [Sphingobacterium paucimobilis HER1398]|uniref:Uncharacterized protein n=2 Tax=Sphingobacterium TaxID=28453 RepID=U2J4L6_9SPHI|nr:hypothetical protein M472_02215 [Sphingobacterium paucimobilis HER1398]
MAGFGIAFVLMHSLFFEGAYYLCNIMKFDTYMVHPIRKRSVFFVYLSMFVFAFSLTSCFDVVEDVSLKSNGSGSIKATVNLSKSKVKVASLMKLDKVDGMKVPSKGEIQNEVNDVVKLLRQTPGISNVQHSLDFNNFIGTLSCDFTNVTALNTFTKTLSTHFKAKVSSYSSYSYDAKTKIFARTSAYSDEAKKGLAKLKPENQKSFSDAFFTSIYRFEDNVLKQDNKMGKVSDNKKAVMMRVGVLDLVNGKVSLSNQISLK